MSGSNTMPKELEAKLRTVIDPELGINVVELGMVRSATVDEDGQASVSLLLTTPACPLWELFEFQVKLALGENTVVRFVTEPKWAPSMMEDGAREELVERGLIDPSRVYLRTPRILMRDDRA